MPISGEVTRRKLVSIEEGLVWLLSAMAKGLDTRAKHDLRNALSIVVAFRQLLDEPADGDLIVDAELGLSRAREVISTVLSRRPQAVA